MRDSTVLVVLLLTTVGAARDGKWERVTLMTGGLHYTVLLHCSTECESN